MSINGSANQHTDDQREQICWDIYVSNLSKGIDNAYDSSIKAGYSEDHSRNITLQGWFKERKARLKRKDMLSKAERNLDEVLDLNVKEEDKIVPQLLKIKSDVSTTIVKTLGKNEGYSERTELTGENGNPILTQIVGMNIINDNDTVQDKEPKTA